jgi:hypothetical protein
VPRGDVDVVQEQPLPWRAPEVYVSFDGGSARTCQVTRHPGDLVRLEIDELDVLPDAQAEIQWTQDGRGCYAAGTVIPPPSGSVPGIYIRVDESVSGIERRLGVRVDVDVPAALTVGSGHVFPGHTEDLSVGGAHVSVDLDEIGEEPVRRWADELAGGAHVVVDLTLPDGVARFACLVAGGGDRPGDARLRFVDVDSGTGERLAAFLSEEQRRNAVRQASTG